MLAILLKSESLAILPLIGFALIGFFCFYFFCMMGYAIYAECANKPMPLDTHYLLGKINNVIWLGSGIIGLILIII